MARDRWDQVKDILNDLLDARPEDPSAWLDARCGDDDALRDDVETLWTAYDDGIVSDDAGAIDWLGGSIASDTRDETTRPDESGTDDFGTDDPAEATPRGGPQTGQRVGRYRIVDEIGAGGMGVVYRAERDDGAFEQPVALKMLRRFIVSRDLERRFRAERQVLASLDHPNVARLIDGGVTDDERPYLVMEYVDGTPITDYADDGALSTEERIGLLFQVVDAVTAAHRNLVVHRDLKPSNVLVTPTDDGPRVKLLDFGIAKILGDDLPLTRPVTQTGRARLTPAYAAPEQITGGDVTTATDTYQLGVLAYELLTGQPPFDPHGKRRSEVERCIVEDVPSAPSSHGGSRGGGRGRRTDDLDVILLKALRKEPDRRYRSPQAFADDLRRYLRREPVRARPATLGYRARTFLRRNTWGVATAVAIVGLLVVVVATVVRERNAARRQAAKAKHVSSFLVDLFRANNPYHAPADTIPARDLLERGKRRLPALDAQPGVQAQILSVIGRAYRSLGQTDSAEVYLQQSLALRRRLHGSEAHPSVATGIEDVAVLRRYQGRVAEAESLHRATLRIRRTSLGHDAPEVATSLNNLGVVLRIQAEYEAADSLYRRALALRRRSSRPDSIRLAEIFNNRGSVLGNLGRHTEAERLHRKALAIWEEAYEGPHPKIARGYHDLALTLERQGRIDDADSLYRTSARIDRKTFGPVSRGVAQSYNNLGTLHGRQGHFARADSFLTASLRIRRALLGSDHPELAESLNNLARLKIETGDYAEAEPLLRRALALDSTEYGSTHPYVAADRLNLGRIAWKQGDVRHAEAAFREAHRILETTLPDDHPRRAEPLFVWGTMLLENGRAAEAAPKLESALAARRRAFPDGHPRIGAAESLLGQCKVVLGRYESAESLLRSGYRALAEADGVASARTRRAADRLIALYVAWDKPDAADALRDSLQRRRRDAPSQ